MPKHMIGPQAGWHGGPGEEPRVASALFAAVDGPSQPFPWTGVHP